MRHSFATPLLAFARRLPGLLLTPFVLAVAAAALFLTDLAFWLWGKRETAAAAEMPQTAAATLVIPNWNGKDLLMRFLPTWVEAIRNHPGSEVLIVDNGSTDGSADWITENYPTVRLLALKENLGFGGGSNAGFRAAKHDICVLLNSDMRVEPGFLQPLLDGFRDPDVFSVSCQIFLSDPAKRREETGLTQGWWSEGGLRVSHKEDRAVDQLFPCFYGGGGSCAYDRRKFLALGGFDELLAPFYLEDTDIGFLAWKRGWKVLYQPASVVYHEHRGTIGKKFTADYISSVLQKNFVLFCWKNIHEWGRLLSHFAFAQCGAAVSAWAGNELTRFSTEGILRAARQLPKAIRSRWRARSQARITDTEAFRRASPAFFHDRFSNFDIADSDESRRLRVLFVSPYPICPPVHGGGVFMWNTLRQLLRWCDVHAVVMLDYADQYEANLELHRYCKSVEFYVRKAGNDAHLASITPHAVDEFFNPDMQWLLERQILTHQIDIVQLEYTSLGQYAQPFSNVVCALFEHDVYFQSITRSIPFMKGGITRLKARFEYLRALRFELNLLPHCDQVQVCTEDNRLYLESFLPELAPKIRPGLRACIDTAAYPYPGGQRKPYTMLFLGSFRHAPNQVALEWFVRDVLPLVLQTQPAARILVAGSDPPPRHSFPASEAIELLGFVEDIQPLFDESAIFICPIRSGSGVRVKLLEAFASGIPVVSTYLGAEGLANVDGEHCLLADDPVGFAERVLRLMGEPELASGLTRRARREVEDNWDAAVATRRLVQSYHELLLRKRGTQPDREPAGFPAHA